VTKPRRSLTTLGRTGARDLVMDARTLKKRRIRSAISASLETEQNNAEFQFERPDWVLYRSIDTLPQKAGVPTNRLCRLVLKEIVDNALDHGGHVELRSTKNGYVVEDNGPGLAASEIVRLFSINRPLLSSKLWRKPTRGALGNGLRVVAGTVWASKGTLNVTSLNLHHKLSFLDDGTTSAVSTNVDFPVGLRIEITFGPELPADDAATSWANYAIVLSKSAKNYSGASSPHWYDANAFYELLQAAGNRPVRDLIAQLDGCTGAKAGRIVDKFKGMSCRSLGRDQSIELLKEARRLAKPVRPERLGTVGKLEGLPTYYSCERGIVRHGSRQPTAEIPFVAEAWAVTLPLVLATDGDKFIFRLCVNRTQVAADVAHWKVKNKINIHGCGLNFQLAASRHGYRVVVNLMTPYCPITTDGKEPDLSEFSDSIADAIQGAVSRAKRAQSNTTSGNATQRAIVSAVLSDSVAKASGDGAYRFSMRQLFYVVRPHIIDTLSVEPNWDNFTGIVTTIESECGPIVGMYRDPRGTLYHPHTAEDIAVGTLAVEQYARPKWTFNKVLFIEKEGFFEALKAAHWPERHDCALLTSKGFGTRAARDLLDLLGDDAEPVAIFCIHDADASGTMIYQSLQEETKARPRRRVEIVNLGLEPWEAVAMGLSIEPRNSKSERLSVVADYVRAHPDGDQWVEWLQNHRAELNAMTTPQFISWLDQKMKDHGAGKLVPPNAVIHKELLKDVRLEVQRHISERILMEGRLEVLVDAAMGTVMVPKLASVGKETALWLGKHSSMIWTGWVASTAADLARLATSDGGK
jgi:hypothetical protein